MIQCIIINLLQLCTVFQIQMVQGGQAFQCSCLEQRQAASLFKGDPAQRIRTLKRPCRNAFQLALSLECHCDQVLAAGKYLLSHCRNVLRHCEILNTTVSKYTITETVQFAFRFNLYRSQVIIIRKRKSAKCRHTFRDQAFLRHAAAVFKGILRNAFQPLWEHWCLK